MMDCSCLFVQIFSTSLFFLIIHTGIFSPLVDSTRVNILLDLLQTARKCYSNRSLQPTTLYMLWGISLLPPQ